MTNMKYWVEMHQGLLEIFAELCIHRSPWINWAPENLLAPSIPHSPSLHDLPLHYLHYGAFFTSTQSIFVCPDPVLLLRLLLEPKSCHSLRYISAHTQERRVAERGAAHTQLCSGMEPTSVCIDSIRFPPTHTCNWLQYLLLSHLRDWFLYMGKSTQTESYPAANMRASGRKHQSTTLNWKCMQRKLSSTGKRVIQVWALCLVTTFYRKLQFLHRLSSMLMLEQKFTENRLLSVSLLFFLLGRKIFLAATTYQL